MNKYANKAGNSKKGFDHNFLEDVYSSMYGEDYNADKIVKKNNTLLSINNWVNNKLTRAKKSPKYKARNEYEEFMRASTLKKSEIPRPSTIEEDLTSIGASNYYSSKKPATIGSLISSIFNKPK